MEVQDYTHYHILGHTVDDAAGEAFDKVARTLGPVSYTHLDVYKRQGLPAHLPARALQ